MKKLLAGILAGAMLFSAASAAGAEEKFPAVNTYPGYADVAEGDWFYSNAKLCYEVGLMTGTDSGFEPNKTLTVGECAALAARMGEKLTGESIPEVDPAHYVVSPPPWWAKYKEYLLSLDPHLTGLLAQPDETITRYGFLSLLNLVCAPERGLLEPINHIEALPDPDFRNDVVALQFYNAGILTGVDKYGTFDGYKSLTRAEAAAMVSRIVRPELRLSFTPADYSPFTAAYLTPGTVMFDSGVTAEEYLIAVNNAISAWEAALGDEFNWHYVWTDGKSVLNHVKDDSLSALGVTAKQGTQAYKDFDVQVYYSRLIDLIGGPLGRTDAPEKAGEARRDYTLTAVELPDGWGPTEDSNNVAAGWATIQRGEREAREEAIYRADGTVLDLGGYFVYGFEHLTSRGSAMRLPVLTFGGAPKNEMDLHDGSLWNFYDVEQGRFLLDTGVLGNDPAWTAAWETYHSSPPTWPQVKMDESSGLYGYVDQAENWIIPAQYYFASSFVDGAAVVHFRDMEFTASAIDETGRELLPRRYSELWYLGDGVFSYWGDLSSWDNDDWRQDCGTVTMEGVESPTPTFSAYFNGGLAAHHGLIAMYHEGDAGSVMAYYDYAGNQVSEDFDWAGPIGDDGAGLVCKDGGLFRIQF